MAQENEIIGERLPLRYRVSYTCCTMVACWKMCDKFINLALEMAFNMFCLQIHTPRSFFQGAQIFVMLTHINRWSEILEDNQTLCLSTKTMTLNLLLTRIDTNCVVVKLLAWIMKNRRQPQSSSRSVLRKSRGENIALSRQEPTKEKQGLSNRVEGQND